jgi:hypothetical protein
VHGHAAGERPPRRAGFYASATPLRWRSIQRGVDWAVAIVLAAAGLIDAIHTCFAEPLPLAVRRRHAVAVLGTVAAASLVLELALGDPANGKQYGF